MNTRNVNIARARAAAFATSILMTALLAACGGGGGGSASSNVASSGGTGGSAGGATGTLSSPQYTAGSAELAAFNQLNAERQQCGFPTVSENTSLDQAAVNHLTYMEDNKVPNGHTELTGNPGFTGVNPQARAQAVGYGTAGGYVGEVNGPFTTDVGGALSVVALTSVPYHEAVLLTPTTDFGMDYSSMVMGPTTTYYVPEIMNGYQGSAPALSNAPLTYPCQGATDVDYESAQMESPAPLGINTGTNPIGTPIAVMGNVTDTIVLSSGQLAGPGGTVINMDLLDSSDDSNGEMQPYEAAAFATSPLQPNTSYSATITGTINGTVFSRNFTFTTGSQGQY